MNDTLFTEELGLFGWGNLEPVVLAALASEYPLLLIGKHGSAKSFLLEALSESLGMEYRFYNASLLNYDDLVGVPIPNKDNSGLTYISGPNSIWEAQIVFIDEINRTKPELQNKLFPIIYEKRVQGIGLDKLVYRWAAMNPPSFGDGDEIGQEYFGALPLDPALADRFPFVMNVPLWEDLSLEDKQRMLDDASKGRHPLSADLNSLIEVVRKKAERIGEEDGRRISEFILVLVELLQKEVGYLSSRRAKMLRQSLIYVIAAFEVIGERKMRKFSFEDIALAHLRSSLPSSAYKPLSYLSCLNLVRNAIAISSNGNKAESEVLLTKDPIERIVKVAKSLGRLTKKFAAEAVLDSLKDIKDKDKRLSLGVLCFLRFRTCGFAPAETEIMAGSYRSILKCRGKLMANDSSCREANRYLSTIDDSCRLKEVLTLLLGATCTHFHYEQSLTRFGDDFLYWGKEMGL